jgi:hypothetical protein
MNKQNLSCEAFIGKKSIAEEKKTGRTKSAINSVPKPV